MNNLQENDLVFAITIEDLQANAFEKIHRRLSSNEIEIAKKGLENGILSSIDDVYKAIFSEMF